MSLPAEAARELPPPRMPWWWVPSLYLAEGLPYVLANNVSVVMFKALGGVSKAQITFFTSLITWPWTIKPLWSPVVDIVGTRRRWTWTMQLVFAASVAALAFALRSPNAFTWSLAALSVLAVASATHDIAADGLYILANTQQQQAYFVGIRTTFYRCAVLLAQGPFVILAGWLAERSGSTPGAWATAMGGMAVLLLALGAWHAAVLPRPMSDRPGDVHQIPEFLREFFRTFGSFFAKPRIGVIIAFLLLYRFGEAQLLKVAPLFLLDPRAQGGQGLTTTEYGFIYGTIGIVAQIVGGILGGVLVARHGLKRWLWIMLLAIHLPDVVFIWLAYRQPLQLPLVQTAIAIEQFGYGFGFIAYVMYMLRIARGPHPTAHYAICTGFMSLGMQLPGMWSGWLADHLGYRHFFTWVVLATVPSFVVAMFIPLEPEFGRRDTT
jgi:MFS transporter, PAT family, beta-lactamase induction signal transducer AmpG